MVRHYPSHRKYAYRRPHRITNKDVKVLARAKPLDVLGAIGFLGIFSGILGLWMGYSYISKTFLWKLIIIGFGLILIYIILSIIKRSRNRDIKKDN